MMGLNRLLLLLATGSFVQGWLPSTTRRAVNRVQQAKGVPEWSVGEENQNDGDATVEAVSAVVSLAAPEPKETPVAPDESALKPQYAALAPGTVVQIQIGDVSLARKAWKKRRRSGSPLLVPCSVLNVDRSSTLRWNCIYLLEKFGASSGRGIRLSFQDLMHRHKTHLKSSLVTHAKALGYETVQELVQQNLFHKQAQESYGVSLLEDDLTLQAPLSRFKARQRAGQTPILQMTPDKDTLLHTGIIRNRNEKTDDNLYSLQPLSAALRIQPESEALVEGSCHAAVVWDYDRAGDAGSPLLTLSLDPSRNQVRQRLKVSPKYEVIQDPEIVFGDLSVGDGPLRGKVIKLVKGGALVDCGVGRNLKDSPDMVRVLGFLSFRDTVVKEAGMNFADDPEDDDDDDDEEEDWDDILALDELDEDDDEGEEDEEDIGELQSFDLSALDEDDDADEISEDITHLFAMNEDGSLTYTDPETGEESKIIMDDDDDDDDDEQVDVEVDMFDDDEDDDEEDVEVVHVDRSGWSGVHRHSSGFSGSRKMLRVGDRIDVFVKSTSKQSSQFALTLDSSVQGMKAKDLKKESDVNKRMKRLSKQIGGLHRIHSLQGEEMDGTVTATSKAGDWFYVKPDGELPVGVAVVNEELNVDLAKGDAVRIQIDGVDEDRGQLALRVLSKLSP